MATLTPLLRPDKVGPDGRAPIYLVIRHGGKKRLVALNLRVRGWNAQHHEARKTEPGHNRVNELLGQAVAAGQSALLDRQAKREPVTAEALAEDVRVPVSPPAGEPDAPHEAADFLASSRSHIEGYKARGQTSTAKAHGAAIQRLSAFIGGRLLFQNLTPALLQTWGRTMRAPAPHGDGLKQSDVRKLLTSVRTIAGPRKAVSAETLDLTKALKSSPSPHRCRSRGYLSPCGMSRNTRDRPYRGGWRARLASLDFAGWTVG